MMTNLFSIFDPSTNLFNLPLNWLSILLGLLFIPYMYWLIPNRHFIFWNFILNKLHMEFKTLLGNSNKSNGSTFIFISLFSFVLFNIFLGLFPYIFTSTSHLTLSLSLSLPLWLSFMFYGWINNSQHMFSHMIPQGTPNILMPFMVLIETISNIIRPGTLAVRLTANMIGSMILAGIMLKLGGYGLLRVMIFIQQIGLKLNMVWVVISLLGGVYISLKCFCQVDIKSLIAYSSVAHMSIVISGVMTLNYWGFMGSYVMMIGHGLCSSGMFCLANINYERFHSRSLFINKGMMNFMPSMSLWWFLLMSSNMAAPPSLNLMGEIMLINSLVSWSWVSMIALMLTSFFSAGYSLYLFSYTQHGKYYSGLYSFYTGVSREYLLLMLHWFPLNFMILKIDYSVIWFQMLS